MKHYGIAQWVDFARGLVPESEQAAMRDHLSTGCSECGELADFCRELSSTCLDAAEYAAPEWVVRSAKAMFPVQAEPRRKRAYRIPVELIYDSFLVPAPAGLRASWQVGWQALYRSGDCSLDLRIEPELASSRSAVVGQISNYSTPDKRMEGILVCLKAGKLIIAETHSNEFGEFQMEFEQQGRLQLCVYLENGTKRFQVPLKTRASDQAVLINKLCLSPSRLRPNIEKQ